MIFLRYNSDEGRDLLLFFFHEVLNNFDKVKYD